MTITFPTGLPGFESCRRFVLVQSDDYAPGVCLRGLDAPQPTFYTIDPRLLVPEYPCVLSSADRARLGVADDTPCVWLALVSPDGDRPVANLSAPIVIDPVTMRGIQVLPTEATCSL